MIGNSDCAFTVGMDGQGRVCYQESESVYCIDARNVVLIPELAHTLQSKPGGGTSLNCTPNILYKLEGTQK